MKLYCTWLRVMGWTVVISVLFMCIIIASGQAIHEAWFTEPW